ncbi:phosphoadenosine phosphosulfate reductase family protein [Candidatus Poribacteria bacterium]
MARGIYWCDSCCVPLQAESPIRCPNCAEELRYLTTDIRPVFAHERRILEFYGHGSLERDAVWRGRGHQYYINGDSISLPRLDRLRRDLPNIAEYIHCSDQCEVLDRHLIHEYKNQLSTSRSNLLALEDEAFQFIQHTMRRFPDRMTMVSFSGGKDSTVVSDLVCRALGRSDVLHVFGDTTLEDKNTYEYVNSFQEQNPQIPFFNAHAEHDFHELVEVMGPPSRVMRWCCTIFKTGPIGNLLQSLGDQKILTFYGIRRNESVRRSQYHKLSWNDPDRLGTVVKVDREDDIHGVTIGAKIGQQATASPIIDWTEFDVWNYILSRGLSFNKSYRLGYSRVGCWLCPLNSGWSEILSSIFYPEASERWRLQLVDFARKIGKPDPEEYVDERAWAKRFGGAGLPNRFGGLESKPCGDINNTVQIEIERRVNSELAEFLKPLGRINRHRARPALGEIYLEGRSNQDWDALIVQALENSTILRFTVINPKQDLKRLTWYFKQQATKFQTCVRCTACSSVCPSGAITVKPEQNIYEIDQDRCTGCMECVTHFGSTGCLVAKSLSVYGNSKANDKAPHAVST